MLQPIQGPRSNSKLPGAMQAFATGAAGGASDVARSYLNNKMQEMYDEKKTNRALAIESDARSRSAQGFTDFLTSSNIISKSQRAEILASLSNMDQQQQSAIVNHLVTKLSSGAQSKRLSGIYGGLEGGAGNADQGQDTTQPSQQPNRSFGQPTMQPAPQPVVQPGTQATSQAISKPLPPGMAPMLNREDMPAEGAPVNPQAIAKSLQMQQGQNELQRAQIQEQIPQASQGTPVQQAQEKPFNYDEEVKRINNETGRALNETNNPTERNEILTARKNAIDMADKRRTGNIAQERLDLKRAESELSREEEKAKPYRESIAGKREQVKEDRESLNLARRAIKMGDTSSWSQFFAQKYSIDPLKSTASQLLNLASKEFTKGALQGISAKAQNQWIEQRFTSMFPSVGTKDDAKETLISALQRSADIKEKEVELYDHYEDMFKRNPSKISKYVDKDLKKFAAERDDQMSYEFSRIKDKYSNAETLYSDDKPINGEYITPEKLSAFTKKYNGNKLKAQNELLKLGYRIPSSEQYLKWKQANEQYGK